MYVRNGLAGVIGASAVVAACALPGFGQANGFGTATMTRAVSGQMVSVQVTLKGIGAPIERPHQCTFEFENAARPDTPVKVVGKNPVEGVTYTFMVKAPKTTAPGGTVVNFRFAWQDGIYVPAPSGWYRMRVWRDAEPLHPAAPTPATLAGRWMGVSNDLEFFRDGTISVKRLNDVALSAVGNYSLIDGNVLRITTPVVSDLLRNVRVSPGKALMLQDGHGHDDILLRQ